MALWRAPQNRENRRKWRFSRFAARNPKRSSNFTLSKTFSFVDIGTSYKERPLKTTKKVQGGAESLSKNCVSFASHSRFDACQLSHYEITQRLTGSNLRYMVIEPIKCSHMAPTSIHVDIFANIERS